MVLNAGLLWVFISIHALREEGDSRTALTVPAYRYFYPRPPRGGRRKRYGDLQVGRQISIHALREEGDLRGRFRGQRLNVFLSTPSARRATVSCKIKPANTTFLSTPSARRATVNPTNLAAFTDRISIHALREEGDVQLFVENLLKMLFLSTPSARRATNRPDKSGRFHRISIHALREEGDRLSLS